MSAFMHRRAFLTLLGGAAAAWPQAAAAQQPVMPVIGVLYGVSEAEWSVQMAGFLRGLSEMGFVAGRNVAIEYRWADGRFDRLPAMAADLVNRKVAVILAGGSNVGVKAAMDATRTLPIVFTTASDPVANGLVASLNRPGGNATGVTFIGSELEPKRLELLHEILPAARKIALLVNPNTVNSPNAIQVARVASRRLGLEIIVVDAAGDSEIDSAFATAVQQQAAALYVTADAYLQSRRVKIAGLGLRHAMPTTSNSRDAVTAGMLMSYGASLADTYRHAGIYVGRILKGDKPSDLPVMQPTKFELVVNLKTAKAIGLRIAETFLVLADEVIE